ncbi:LPS translocon maturation chaperone LptM [Paenibacillus sp. P22]|uniref:LPS translocon maturation chaperone LptM n=1 Tax=Paenibacillus sp. P22 TaxID=483908 RepID=UPI0035B52A0A
MIMKKVWTVAIAAMLVLTACGQKGNVESNAGGAANTGAAENTNAGTEQKNAGARHERGLCAVRIPQNG